MNKQEKDNFLTPGQAAKELNIHRETLRRYETAGKILSTRTKGGHRRYRKEDVQKLKSKLIPNYQAKDLITISGKISKTSLKKDTLGLANKTDAKRFKALVEQRVGVTINTEHVFLSHPSDVGLALNSDDDASPVPMVGLKDIPGWLFLNNNDICYYTLKGAAGYLSQGSLIHIKNQQDFQKIVTANQMSRSYVLIFTAGFAFVSALGMVLTNLSELNLQIIISTMLLVGLALFLWRIDKSLCASAQRTVNLKNKLSTSS